MTSLRHFFANRTEIKTSYTANTRSVLRVTLTWYGTVVSVERISHEVLW